VEIDEVSLKFTYLQLSTE